MRRLLLLRHAEADRPFAVEDHERPLSERGQRQSAIIGEYMAREKLVPDMAVVSTARRTQDTWQLAQAYLGADIPQRNEPRIYEAAHENIIDVIKDTPDHIGTLLLVGHNPGFERLATTLAATGRPSAMALLEDHFPTGSLAVIDLPVGNWREVSAGAGHLESFKRPTT
ncbi:MAG TPA: histidine phosphatase family protein [Candidimonas sp.]|nr:histidine phosphatase family protein [Candidimonas sp.]